MDADVLGDLVARERRSERPALRAGESRTYSAHKFCTDAWKAASLFRYNGVGAGRRVAVADDDAPEVLLSFFGAALLGAPVRFREPGETEAALVVSDAAAVDDWTVGPGTKRVAYDGPPEDPTVAHFERDIWSENPTMPPDEVGPDADALVTAEASFTHAALLETAREVVEETALTGDDEVAVRTRFSDQGTVVAGVVAPRLAGASILLPGESASGTVAVTDGDAPESRRIDPSTARP